MCIISDSVNHVAATKLFGMPSVDGRRQLTVYTNTVDTAKTNVMCLPVPNPGSVKFETVPDKFFQQCADSIQKEAIWGARSFSLSLSNDGPTKPYLAVQSHGSYDVVTVPSIDDLDRIPPTFAVLTAEVIQFLRTNYPADYGVLLCRLRTGTVRYEPFAYSHDMADNGCLFLPTKHYHVHTDDMSSRNPYSGMDSFSPYASFSGGAMINNTTTADWDHEIYTIMTIPREAHNTAPRKLPKERNVINWSEMPAEFRLNPGAHVKLFERVGAYFPNEDLSFRVSTGWIMG
jgi:hypothetical protein